MRYLTKTPLLLSLLALLISPGALLAQASIEEIVVTAQKREESLSDVPISITALTAATLDSDNVLNVGDLGSMAPGLVVAKNEGFSRAVAIRGIGFEATQNINAFPSVAFHIDGVFIADPNAMNLDFIDVDRIEVLRGPQGTLFGQNSTGGGINVVNNVPELDEFSGKADISVGNYGLVQPRATINVPMGETLAVRASATYLNHNGFSEVTGGATDINGNSIDGYDLDEADNFQFQGKLLWQPTDNFSAIFSATNFSISDVGDRAQRHVNDPSGDIRDVTTDTPGSYDSESEIYSLTLEYDAGVATVKSITGYVTFDQDNYLDMDKGLPSFAGARAESVSIRDSETWTQEINIVSNTDGRLDWIVGGFYLHSEIFTWFDSVIDFGRDGAFGPDGIWLGPQQAIESCAFVPGSDRDFCINQASKRESWSIYGQVTYKLMDNLRFTGGMRYTDDRLTAWNGGFSPMPPTDVTFKPKDTEVTGKAGFEYDLSDDLMAYFSWTRGFKPGTVNLTGDATDPIVPAVAQAEKIDAFEIGAKGRFADGRLNVNAAAFYYDYSQMQFLGHGAGRFTSGVGNLPEAEVMGVELELRAVMSEGFSVDAGLSFLDTEIKAGPDYKVLEPGPKAVCNATIGNWFGPEYAACNLAASTNVDGNSLPKAPDFSANIALNHVVNTSFGEISSRLSYIHRDSFASRVFQSGETDSRGRTLDTTKGYDLFNLSINLTPANYENITVGLLVLNLTDENAINSRWTNNFGTYQTSEEFVRPRQFIGRISYNF